ncbi:unnamed protein product, partial [Discosporangium mesarthrocarpum]
CCGKKEPTNSNFQFSWDSMPHSRRSRGSPDGGTGAQDRGHSGRRRRRRGWIRLCRLAAKRKWRGIGAMGVLTILLAATLLCLMAYFEKWGQNVDNGASLDSSAPAPTTEDPMYFEDKEIPEVFEQYAHHHNSATAKPRDAKYVIYEIPGNTTLVNSLLGLTSTYLFALMSDRVLLVEWTADYEAPGAADIGGPSGRGGGKTSRGDGTPNSDRTSSLSEIFLDPGFYWSWERFVDRWENLFGYPKEELRSINVDVMESYDSLVCVNLKTSFMKDEQFIKVTNTEYFAAMLTVNQFGSKDMLEDIPAVDTFAYLSNWLMRPVATVTAAVRRFKETYLEDNYVIGLEIDLFPSTSEWERMPALQQQLFFQEASDASYRAASNLGPNQQGIVVLVVTDDEAALRSRLADLGQDSLGAAGVVAITGPRGEGTNRLLTELQQAWLLGYGDICIVSPSSAIGVLGHARMSLSPIVIIDGQTAHQATSSQPCLADVGLIQHASCFVPGMLSHINYDPNVPCLGSAPSTVADSERLRSRNLQSEL